MGPGEEIFGVFGWVERRKASQLIQLSDDETIGSRSAVPMVFWQRSLGNHGEIMDTHFSGRADGEMCGCLRLRICDWALTTGLGAQVRVVADPEWSTVEG
jgi:hypothetical protein